MVVDRALDEIAGQPAAATQGEANKKEDKESDHHLIFPAKTMPRQSNKPPTTVPKAVISMYTNAYIIGTLLS